MPETPEKLLRSRYTAYHSKNAEYIADTTHPDSEEWTGTRATYISAVKSTQVRHIGGSRPYLQHMHLF